ncbi:hypothetical protein CFC21_084568 [Triticum aestivum]|uniref:Uncharacterized protein n=3 Tax=Triticum TaxID=4564 RepID=A0A9R0Y784_TRITD|nr:hypothetical protein CFC21_084568 [Triticum aestivum]VAI49656.1 unnamed protein product [Triticum turgidum subsp. durum]
MPYLTENMVVVSMATLTRTLTHASACELAYQLDVVPAINETGANSTPSRGSHTGARGEGGTGLPMYVVDWFPACRFYPAEKYSLFILPSYDKDYRLQSLIGVLK